MSGPGSGIDVLGPVPTGDSTLEILYRVPRDSDVIDIVRSASLHHPLLSVYVAGTGLPMALARVGIPAGLAFDPSELRDLQEEGVIDFFETTEKEIRVYVTGLREGERRDRGEALE